MAQGALAGSRYTEFILSTVYGRGVLYCQYNPGILYTLYFYTGQCACNGFSVMSHVAIEEVDGYAEDDADGDGAGAGGAPGLAPSAPAAVSLTSYHK